MIYLLAAEFTLSAETVAGLLLLIAAVGAQLKLYWEIKKGNTSTEKVHEIVNSQRTKMEEELKFLRGETSALRDTLKTLAEKRFPASAPEDKEVIGKIVNP